MASTTLVSGCDKYGQHAADRVVIGKFGMWELDTMPDTCANKFTINM